MVNVLRQAPVKQREDNLSALLTGITFGLPKEKIWILRVILGSCFIFIEGHVIVASIIVIVRHRWKNLCQMMTVCMIQPGCVGIYLMAFHMQSVLSSLELLRRISSKLDIQDDIFEEQIRKKSRREILVAGIVIMTNLLSNGFFVPFWLHDDTIDIIDWFVKNYYNERIRNVIIIWGDISIFIASYGLTVILYYIMYISFHITLQINWLFRYIKVNLRKPISNDCMLDNKYQENIRCHLKEVAKYHLNFKKSFDTLGKIQDSASFLLCISGLMMAVTTTYFLLSDMESNNKLKAFVAMIYGILVFLLLCIKSQNITDATSKITENLYKCPWIYFNTENRRTLLLIMVGGLKEWEITCYNIYPINNKFITQGFKQVYTLVTAVVNFRNKNTAI